MTEFELRRERAYTPEQREDFKLRVLEVARAQMAKEGAAALSLRAIARELGVTAPALYRYFADRDALITALLVAGFTGLAVVLESSDAAGGTGYCARMAALAAAYRTWALAYPNDFLLLFGTPIPAYEAPGEVTVPLATRAIIPFVVPLAEAERAGGYRAPEPPPNAAVYLRGIIEAQQYPTGPGPVYAGTLFWSSVHGMVALEITGHLAPVVGDMPASFSEYVARLIAATGLPPDSS